jgi:hypothetical protein
MYLVNNFVIYKKIVCGSWIDSCISEKYIFKNIGYGLEDVITINNNKVDHENREKGWKHK